MSPDRSGEEVGSAETQCHIAVASNLVPLRDMITRLRIFIRRNGKVQISVERK